MKLFFTRNYTMEQKQPPIHHFLSSNLLFCISDWTGIAELVDCFTETVAEDGTGAAGGSSVVFGTTYGAEGAGAEGVEDKGTFLGLPG